MVRSHPVGSSLPLRWIPRAFGLAAVLAFSSPAGAQSASDKAAAEALFDEGVKLLKAGKTEEACPKLERSQKVAPGIGTLLYLGECYKRAGRTASAWATFREAASKAEAAGESDRARAGRERANELEPKLSRILFAVDPANLQIGGLEIRQGSTSLNRALWGSSAPVDPGQLVIEASAPGYESFQTTVEVKEGPSEQEVQIPALVKLPEEAPVAKEAVVLAAVPEDVGRPLSTQRTVGLFFGGAGLVGLGLGGVFGVAAIINEQKAQENCGDGICQTGTGGIDDSNRANTFATASTIAFVAGGALLATGLVLYYTAPATGKTARIELTPTFGGAHMSMGSSF